VKRPAAKGEQCPRGIIADERGGCESDALIADDSVERRFDPARLDLLCDPGVESGRRDRAAK
jgi:hypothetical protein